MSDSINFIKRKLGQSSHNKKEVNNKMNTRHGWASSGKSTPAERNTLNLLEQERFLNTQDIDDIPVIPDLDDFVVEIGSEKSEASKPASAIKTSIKELDSTLVQQTSVEGIDLSLLAKCILSNEELKEDDVVWTWNNTFIQYNDKSSNNNKIKEDTK